MLQEDQKHVCKFCSKMFPCGRSLGGHMRSHLINISDPKECKECGKAFQSNKALFGHMKSHSLIDHQTGKKGIKGSKRYDLTIPNIDHQDQQEVALSLLLLSMDSFNKIETESSGPFVQRKRSKRDDFFESEVSSETDKSAKFRCVICKKGFPSYQALGGHRASHKKFKGCCAPNSPLFEQKTEIKKKKNKDHECPICFKVFQSGQALGGHKRSHIVGDQTEKVAPQIRGFLDLNLPAPAPDDEDEFKPWWIATSLLSSS